MKSGPVETWPTGPVTTAMWLNNPFSLQHFSLKTFFRQYCTAWRRCLDQNVAKSTLLVPLLFITFRETEHKKFYLIRFFFLSWYYACQTTALLMEIISFMWATTGELCPQSCLQKASHSHLDTLLASHTIIVSAWCIQSGHTQTTERMLYTLQWDGN